MKIIKFYKQLRSLTIKRGDYELSVDHDEINFRNKDGRTLSISMTRKLPKESLEIIEEVFEGLTDEHAREAEQNRADV